MEEQEQQPDKEAAITSEESLQEKEKPPDDLKQQQAAATTHQEPPQQVAQTANQEQPTQRPIGNHHGHIPHKTAISTTAAVPEESHDINSTSATIDSTATSQKSLQEQEKPLEQATTQSNKQTQAGQQHKDHTKVQNDRTQASSSREAIYAHNTMHPTTLTELLPKEWQKHHDTWLNLVMTTAIGDNNPPPIPDFHTHIPVLRPGPDLDIDVAPIKTYVTRYDLRIKVKVGENQVELFHQAFCKWFLN